LDFEENTLTPILVALFWAIFSLGKQENRSSNSLGMPSAILCMMGDTVISLTQEQQERLIKGYTPGGKPTSAWDFDVMAPAGALRSTADDLLRFLDAHMAKEPHELSSVMQMACRKQVERKTDSLGLGWHIDATGDEPIYWHNGGTGGFASFVGFRPAQRFGVVILSNNGDAMKGIADIDGMGFKVLHLNPT
jgi:CubicO group peptidase (beta-lactamase class C family)